MPDITDPEAITFCNEKIRPISDRMAQLYYDMVRLRDEWVANDLGTLIPDTSDSVIDGSSTDGRHPITGADVHAIADRATDLIADYEANTNLKLNTVLLVAVNPQR